MNIIDKIKWRKAHLSLWWKWGGNITLNRKAAEQYLIEDGGIEAGKRLGIFPSEVLKDWYCAYSPRNGVMGQPEGPIDDWVILAHWVIKEAKKKYG